MTGALPTSQARRDKIASRAEAQAQALAAASGISVRTLHDPADMELASALLATIWKAEGNAPHIDPGLLVALAHAHNYVAGAYRGADLIAVCVGFFHPPPDRALHSHIAGVRGGSVGAGVGKALKHHERAWCLRRGTDTMTWTFDPLIARNAYFNIHRLGTAASEYLPNFYGEMTDSINRGQDSDRMLLAWDLLREPGARIAAGTPEPEACVLHNEDGVPRLCLDSPGSAQRVRVEIPSDIETMRIEHPERAARWRPALREALAPLMNDGWQVTDFARRGHYSLERTPARAHSQH
ncbi:hypothetical protein [Arthrobacter sp. CJ23]|uniref:hypothetical protein n=1 Tax=Arthrobacter sp. CJ23 TaxID=2972479 RepID=UPI00215CEA9F|nr:hypothetical protein [Arthrobacter sp. CJ23]UVJ37766.1 hypothetical protein NVV90_10750 [Arthrobacter sp. CJ23]UVJ37793.1 hypothetical protein NVV90_10895 [Arthrobacter sp. CJ23]